MKLTDVTVLMPTNTFHAVDGGSTLFTTAFNDLRQATIDNVPYLTFVGAGDNSTNDTTALNAILASAGTIAASTGGAVGVLVPPAPGGGPYLIDGEHVIPNGVKLFAAHWSGQNQGHKLFKLRDGRGTAGVTCVFCSANWLRGNSPSSTDDTVFIENITIDCNRANGNTGVHGIVVTPYRSWLVHNWVYDPGQSGIVCADMTNTGHFIPAKAQENRFIDNLTTYPGITTTAAGAADGTTTLTVASAAGLVVGWMVTDNDRPSAIAAGTSITNISGTTLTLSQATTSGAGNGVHSGDSLKFEGPVTGQHGFWATHTLNAGGNSDSYLIRQVVSGSGDNAIHLDSAGDWSITDCHPWAIHGQCAFYIDQANNTRVLFCNVDNPGYQPLGPGHTYYGIRIAGMSGVDTSNGQPSVIAANHFHASEQGVNNGINGSDYYYLSIVGPSTKSNRVSVGLNGYNQDNATSGISQTYDFSGPGGGTLYVSLGLESAKPATVLAGGLTAMVTAPPASSANVQVNGDAYDGLVRGLYGTALQSSMNTPPQQAHMVMGSQGWFASVLSGDVSGGSQLTVQGIQGFPATQDNPTTSGKSEILTYASFSTTASADATGSTVTVTSATGIRKGMMVKDITTSGHVSSNTTVTNISGTTITFSKTTTIANGETLEFSGWEPLARVQLNQAVTPAIGTGGTYGATTTIAATTGGSFFTGMHISEVGVVVVGGNTETYTVQVTATYDDASTQNMASSNIVGTAGTVTSFFTGQQKANLYKAGKRLVSLGVQAKSAASIAPTSLTVTAYGEYR